MKSTPNPSRRAFLGSSALAAASLPFAGAALARPDRTGDYQYEYQLSELEWRGKLTKYEYEILRNSGTEWAKSSEFWDDYSEGEFACRGCDLHVYSSAWRVELDKGWVFFSHAQPTAVLMDIDRGANYSMSGAGGKVMIEAHCRRCGSHLGHILTVDGKLVHCINGASLAFTRATG